MFSLLGRTEKDVVAEETERIPFAISIAKQLALGGGLATGGGVVFGAFELLRDNPHDAFPLLKSWGAWPIVTAGIVWVLYDLAKMLLSMLQRFTIAVENLAGAQQQAADKDDRQIQEIQTLSAYSAQSSERTADSMRDLHDKVDNLTAAVQTAIKEKGQ